MSEPTVSVNTILENKVINIPYTTTTTAEDVCISLSKQLGIGTVARHLFGLSLQRKQIFLMNSATFGDKNPTYELRIRYKVYDIIRLKKIDIKAYDYYFHQVRNDVLENRIADLVYEKYKRELVGLGVTDMYRVMLEKDIPREVVETDYKKYIPKEVIKRNTFFIKKPIHDALGKIKRSGHDAWYVKGEYLKQVEIMAPEYLSEEYKAFADLNGIVCALIVKVSPYLVNSAGIKYCHESKKDNWIHICTFDELGFVSIRRDGTLEISRKNGIPFYLKFLSLPCMFSFVSLLDGYYRLTYKWTFNICKDIPTPSLKRLYNMKCHGPVGGEFSYAKLEEKCDNKPGCFILRESESKYNIYYIDVCPKNSIKPQTYKLERLPNNEYVFNDDPRRFSTISEIISAYNDPEDAIYLAECIPPSEYDISPLLLCKREKMSGDALTEGSFSDASLPKSPVCINSKDLQVYKGRKCLKWDKKRKNNIRVENSTVSQDKFSKVLFPDLSLSRAKKACRNPDGNIGGPWCLVEIDDSNDLEKELCDIPFCDDQECTVFTKNYSVYSHYTHFQNIGENFTFGVKLWNPDDYIQASARVVLTLFALPITGKEIEELAIGIEVLLTNSKTALTFGIKEKKVEYETTKQLIKSTEYTYFTLSWSHGFLTFSRLNVVKPIFLSEFKTKKNLLGFKMDKFNYYTAQGTNILWTFPFCSEDDICNVHVTTGPQFQQFWPLRQANVGYDLEFNLRAVHSASILLLSSPTLDYPQVLIILGRNDTYTRIFAIPYPTASKILLAELAISDLLSQWRWHHFSLSLFSNTMHLYKTLDIGPVLLFEVKHQIIKQLRWYSVSSDYTRAHWTFYCRPTARFIPSQAWLPECALNEHELNYVGTQDVTRDGVPCVPWGASGLIPGSVRDMFGVGKEIYEAWDYCRDPANDNKGTYCYTIQPDRKPKVQKTFCQIRKCKSSECRMAGTGNDYIGKINTTRSNRTCQYWAADIPLVNFDSFIKKDNKYLSQEEIAQILTDPAIIAKVMSTLNTPPANNTAIDETDSKPLEEFNDFNEFVIRYKMFADARLRWMRSENVSVLGQRHVLVHTVGFQFFNTTLYADMSVEKAENFCRNPSRNIAGSWCYTLDPVVPRDVCHIKDCDNPEECIIISRGNSEGRQLYILPQWKETGHHGGIRFSIKHWDPDKPEGLEFHITSFSSRSIYTLQLGAHDNEKIILWRDKNQLKEKTMSHVISSGKWAAFWLQIRRGELQLGFEGVPHSLFEWRDENKTTALEPVFVRYGAIGGNAIGMHFKCDECQTENTTVAHFSKILPIGIWDTNELQSYTNFTLHLRGLGIVRIRLMHLPGSGDYYFIKLDSSKRLITFAKNIKHLQTTLREVTITDNITLLSTVSWTVYNMSFAEEYIEIEINGTRVFRHDSARPLLFYWFSVGVELGWVTWSANCEPLDIDGPPLDGGWSKWSAWECTVSCGGGEGYRTRTCSNPRPNIFGKMCEGEPTTTGRCNDFPCGDLSPGTLEMVRESLQTGGHGASNRSLVVSVGDTVTVGSNSEVLAAVRRESPEAHWEWTLNGAVLSGERYVVDSDDNIVISKAQLNDSGVYACMIYRINGERLVLHVVTLAVRTDEITLFTRETREFTVHTHAVILGYIYTDLHQLWSINNQTYHDFGNTVNTLAAIATEHIHSANHSHDGEWRCVIQQRDLGLSWTTNIVRVRVGARATIFTHLREDHLTAPLFAWLRTDTNVMISVVVIVVFVCVAVTGLLLAYLKWGRMPALVRKKRRERRKKRGKASEEIPMMGEGASGYTTDRSDGGDDEFERKDMPLLVVHSPTISPMRDVETTDDY